MRSLLYIVICSIALACSTSALANKAQLPNEIVLKLNQPAVAGQSLTLITALSSVTDFYQGSASLVISSLDKSNAGAPIELFSGDGEAGFDLTSEIQLPALAVGKYKVHGTFFIYRTEKDERPIRAGSNLYLDVRADEVLSSSISFTQIKRRELQARLEAQKKDLQTNDIKTLRAQNPELHQALDAVNQVPAIQTNRLPSIKAKTGNAMAKQALNAQLVQSIELSSGQQESADPRKRLKQQAVRLDRKNAVLEKQENDF